MRQPETSRAESLDNDHTRAQNALGDKLAGLWWTFVLRGILTGGVGIAALFWPTASISLLLRLVAVLLIFDGGLTLIGWGRGGPVGGIGIAAILIGLILLIWPEGVARFTFFLLGALALITGTGSLMTWKRMPEWDPERPTLRNAGVMAFVVGLALVFWPGSGLLALGWAIAFAALSVAFVMFWLAARFKRANERLSMRVGSR